MSLSIFRGGEKVGLPSRRSNNGLAFNDLNFSAKAASTWANFVRTDWKETTVRFLKVKACAITDFARVKVTFVTERTKE